MKVKYWWSDDGVSELCTVSEQIANKELTCSHKGTCKIMAADKFYKLTSTDNSEYILCDKCFNTSTKILY